MLPVNNKQDMYDVPTPCDAGWPCWSHDSDRKCYNRKCCHIHQQFQQEPLLGVFGVDEADGCGLAPSTPDVPSLGLAAGTEGETSRRAGGILSGGGTDGLPTVERGPFSEEERSRGNGTATEKASQEADREGKTILMKL